MFFKRKIDEDILKYHFSKDKKLIGKEIESTDLGIGWINVPIETWRKSKEFTNTDFKECINKYFQPLIANQGFTGKDYKFYKEDDSAFYFINFFPDRNGGGTQVDLLVKVKRITYPPKHFKFNKSKSAKYCEFSKRLSPINTSVWHWAFKSNKDDNKTVLEDIYRIILEKGIPYFKQFENLDSILSKITIETFENLKYGIQDPKTGFPSFHREFYEDIFPSIYFVFKHADLNDDKDKAFELAKYGIGKLHKPYEKYQRPYTEEFENYIKEK
ncbi:hypothetical protein [uncultured Dokdonia sp.]|uniref:hypothetical protein n=1 Tax=uncultured Dokdonia sp. TaxID=575653 RepID=UPI00261D77BC|nr:hypothetical protein [uncultured Dokdonia sp.]